MSVKKSVHPVEEGFFSVDDLLEVGYALYVTRYMLYGKMLYVISYTEN